MIVLNDDSRVPFRSSNIDYMKDDDEQPEYPVFSQTITKNSARKKSESIFMELIERCDGTLCSFSEALPQLVYFDKKQRRRIPWNCDLEIGQDFGIKIAAYIYVSDPSLKSDALKIVWRNLSFLVYFVASSREGNRIVEVS